jgi:hypothetical protein
MAGVVSRQLGPAADGPVKCANRRFQRTVVLRVDRGFNVLIDYSAAEALGYAAVLRSSRGCSVCSKERR